MAGFRSVLATFVLSTGALSRQVVAQTGTATAVHTVSVTIPARVKVQVSSLATPQISSASTATENAARGVAVNVTATQPWTLSIAVVRKNPRAVKWSRSRHGNFTSLSADHATIASGARGTTSADATLFLRTDRESTPTIADESPVLLTIAAQ